VLTIDLRDFENQGDCLMSSASSPVRRPAAPAPNVVNAPARSSPAPSPSAAPASRTSYAGLDAADIPPLDTNLEIEALKPTLLSRLFDLFAPKR
jgi:hypothetical protein